MTVRARFRYLSASDPEDTTPITLPGTLNAVPGIVEPGDVFQVELDDQAITHGLDEHGATVEVNAADAALESLEADGRFERVDDDEPLELPRASNGMTAADLRAALEHARDVEGAELPESLPRKRAELADLYDALVGPPVPSELEES